jgi:hypothetical protein
MKVEFRTTKMTRQTREVALQRLQALPVDGGHDSIDVFDSQGEVGHCCVFRGRNGNYYCRCDTPDPRDLYAKLKRSLRVNRLTLAIMPWTEEIS